MLPWITDPNSLPSFWRKQLVISGDAAGHADPITVKEFYTLMVWETGG